jgi:hypothetical protein
MSAYCHAMLNSVPVCVPPPTSTASGDLWPLAFVMIVVVACIVRLRCAAE